MLSTSRRRGYSRSAWRALVSSSSFVCGAAVLGVAVAARCIALIRRVCVVSDEASVVRPWEVGTTSKNSFSIAVQPRKASCPAHCPARWLSFCRAQKNVLGKGKTKCTQTVTKLQVNERLTSELAQSSTRAVLPSSPPAPMAEKHIFVHPWRYT